MTARTRKRARGAEKNPILILDILRGVHTGHVRIRLHILRGRLHLSLCQAETELFDHEFDVSALWRVTRMGPNIPSRK